MSSLPSRKRPHPPDQNAGGDAKSGSNIKVVVRIRPQNVKEVEGNFRVVVQAVDENILVFDPKENSGMDLGGRKGRRDIRKRQNRDLKFAFDRVFGPDAKNTDIYKETTNSVISGVLDGYNCSVFAYGATGAGKTYTMLGSKEQPGVMYHTMMDLYSHIDGMKDNQTCDVAVSYLEVYNETIRDLLMPGGPLPIREDPGKGVVIPGLSLHKPKNAEELLYMLQYGNQHRSQHPTDANAESSRSHAVFQVFVRQQDRTANISTEVRVAKMCLVDLAGSERATVTKNQGSRFREGANINRSLLALGNVINALAENKNKGFVPYRDSKLTRLLKDSLGGNCQTVMIAAVSPSAMSFEDTYNTLRYADRAKNIKATLKKNVLNVDFHMAKYGQIVTELRKEISELKSKLKNYEEGTISPVSVSVVPDMSSCVSFQSELDKFFMAHLAQRSDQVQQEISLRNLQWKLYRKRRCIARVKAINDEENQHRLESVVKGMSQKSSCLTVSTDVSRGKLEQNMACFYDIENRWKGNVEGEHGQKVLDLSVHGHTTRLELQDTKQYLSFTKQVIRYQERELEHNERLVLQLLRLLRNQHFIMKGHNILTSDLEEEFKDILKKVRGQEVTWGDQQGDDELCRGTSLSEMLDLPTVKLKLTPGSNDVKRPQTKPDVHTVRNTAPKVWPSQPAAHNKPLPYTQVDECSPPKAKRIMLTHPSVQQSVRNDAEKLRQPQRNVSSISRSHVMRSKRRRSYSESSHVRNRYMSKDVKFTSNIPNNVPLRVLENNETDSSPDWDENQKSRFSKINDTITKAKKFSTLHTKSVSESRSDDHKVVKQSVSVKSDNLDSTFTVDDNENVPVKLPCIDIGDGSVSQACVLSSSGQAYNGGHDTKQLHVNERNLGVKSCNSEHKNSVQNNDTLPCNLVSSELNITHDIDPDRLESGVNDSNASTLVNQSSSSQTSVASTLVANLSQNLSNIEENENPSEQSSETHEESVESVIERSESQASICDKDEKVDGENVDTTNTKQTSGSINAPKLGDTVTKVHKRNSSSPNPGVANGLGTTACLNVVKLGATVTKVHKRNPSSPNPGVENTQQTSVSNNVPKLGATVTKVHKRDSSSPKPGFADSKQDKNTIKAARCIKFGDKRDSECFPKPISRRESKRATITKDHKRDSSSPKPGVADSKQDRNTIKAARCIKFGDKRDSGGHTYVINGRKSGTPDRRPLYQLGDSNTPPILSDRSSFGSSSNSSDNDLSFDKALNKLRHSAAKLFDKENSKMTSKFPLLSEGSLIINNNGKSKKSQSSTPGYMQATKAHNHRIKHNKSTKSDGEKLDNGPGRVRTSTSGNRPLQASMRSKSMSNLSSRSGWQI